MASDRRNVQGARRPGRRAELLPSARSRPARPALCARLPHLERGY